MSKAEKGLPAYLMEGELVCWHGVTEPFRLLDDFYRVRILLKWIVTLVIGGGLIGLIIHYATENVAKIVIVIFAICLIILLSPLLERRKLLKQEYWITNLRAIMMIGNGTFYSVKLSDLTAIDDMSKCSDSPSFVLGSKVLGNKKDLRWRACHPLVANGGSALGGQCTGLIFYCVSDGQGARDYLQEKSGITIS